MRSFRDLQVWEKAHQLVLDVYRESRAFPDAERYGLTSQVRRAAASIPTNIAEGSGREGDKEFIYFLSVASGSTSEVEYQVLLAKDLHYLDEEAYRRLDAQAGDVKKMIHKLIARLRESGISS